MKKALILALSTFMLVSCNEADRASQNLATAADNFEVTRHIVFVNGITGDHMLEINGLCSKDSTSTDTKVSITCKVGPNEYKRHMMGLSDNVTYIIEQTDAVKADPYHYRMVFRPAALIPDIQVK